MLQTQFAAITLLFDFCGHLPLYIQHLLIKTEVTLKGFEPCDIILISRPPYPCHFPILLSPCFPTLFHTMQSITAD